MENNNIKYMPIKDFVNEGYLQEVNRCFLHPLGLALEVGIDDNEQYTISGVWDYRDDPEGMQFALNKAEDSRIQRFQDKKMSVDAQREKLRPVRETLFNGSIIEPISNEAQEE